MLRFALTPSTAGRPESGRVILCIRKRLTNWEKKSRKILGLQSWTLFKIPWTPNLVASGESLRSMLDTLFKFSQFCDIKAETHFLIWRLMNCHRCGSLMIHQDFYSADERFSGWRCIGCGEIVDEVILENRKWTPLGRQGKRKQDAVIPDDIDTGD